MKFNDPPIRSKIELLGVAFDCVTEEEAVNWICSRSESGQGGFIVTANLDHLRRCRIDPTYAQMVANADLVVADGMPLIWASRLRGKPDLPERVAGSTLVLQLCAAAAHRNISIFLLGGDPGVAERAASVLVQKHPQLVIAGTHCPPFGYEKDSKNMSDIQAALAGSHPGILLVALGSPKQEKLINEVRHIHPGACWIGVGISLSFVTGDVTRAPIWMQQCGMEWVHRLAQEPRRLFARYILHGIPWGLRLLSMSIVDRLAGMISAIHRSPGRGLGRSKP
jgi:N-acetylglucosaminyldiphosphoundecaprenol N-acetyl-beta-D-mannosaminyltransferase